MFLKEAKLKNLKQKLLIHYIKIRHKRSENNIYQTLVYVSVGGKLKKYYYL